MTEFFISLFVSNQRWFLTISKSFRCVLCLFRNIYHINDLHTVASFYFCVQSYKNLNVKALNRQTSKQSEAHSAQHVQHKTGYYHLEICLLRGNNYVKLAD